MIRQLNLSNFETYFILGCVDFEKNEKRRVLLNISIRFCDDVEACENDALDDTICYASLALFINEKLENASFNLIERAAQFLYAEITNYLGDKKYMKSVEVIKPQPPVTNLESASFVCSDW